MSDAGALSSGRRCLEGDSPFAWLSLLDYESPFNAVETAETL